MSEVCKCMRYVKHVNVYFANQNTMQRVGVNGELNFEVLEMQKLNKPVERA